MKDGLYIYICSRPLNDPSCSCSSPWLKRFARKKGCRQRRLASWSEERSRSCQKVSVGMTGTALQSPRREGLIGLLLRLCPDDRFELPVGTDHRTWKDNSLLRQGHAADLSAERQCAHASFVDRTFTCCLRGVDRTSQPLRFRDTHGLLARQLPTLQRAWQCFLGFSS